MPGATCSASPPLGAGATNSGPGIGVRRAVATAKARAARNVAHTSQRGRLADPAAQNAEATKSAGRAEPAGRRSAPAASPPGPIPGTRAPPGQARWQALVGQGPPVAGCGWHECRELRPPPPPRRPGTIRPPQPARRRPASLADAWRAPFSRFMALMPRTSPPPPPRPPSPIRPPQPAGRRPASLADAWHAAFSRFMALMPRSSTPSPSRWPNALRSPHAVGRRPTSQPCRCQAPTILTTGTRPGGRLCVAWMPRTSAASPSSRPNACRPSHPAGHLPANRTGTPAILILVGPHGLSTSWPDLFRPSPQHGASMDGRPRNQSGDGHDDVVTRCPKMRIAAGTRRTAFSRFMALMPRTSALPPPSRPNACRQPHPAGRLPASRTGTRRVAFSRFTPLIPRTSALPPPSRPSACGQPQPAGHLPANRTGTRRAAFSRFMALMPRTSALPPPSRPNACRPPHPAGRLPANRTGTRRAASSRFMALMPRTSTPPPPRRPNACRLPHPAGRLPASVAHARHPPFSPPGPIPGTRARGQGPPAASYALHRRRDPRRHHHRAGRVRSRRSIRRRAGTPTVPMHGTHHSPDGVAAPPDPIPGTRARGQGPPVASFGTVDCCRGRCAFSRKARPPPPPPSPAWPGLDLVMPLASLVRQTVAWVVSRILRRPPAPHRWRAPGGPSASPEDSEAEGGIISPGVAPRSGPGIVYQS